MDSLPPRSEPPTNASRWSVIARQPAFGQLTRAKTRFIVPSSIFFILYYFALPVLVGYFPHLMQRKVLGAINLAYVFALSQFFMAWIIMWLYVRQARRWDRMEHEIIQTHLANTQQATSDAYSG